MSPLLVDADHVLQRAGHEEVLLLEAKPLAPQHLVVRVEDLGDVLRVHLLVHRAPVVALVEGLEVEGLGGLCLPQAQEVRGAVPVAEDRRVVGDPAHDALRHPAHPVAAPLVLEALRLPAQGHVVGDLRTGRSPRGCRGRATCRSSRPASRRGSAGRRSRTRSGSRSRAWGSRAWRASPCSRRPAGRAPRCRDRAPPPGPGWRRGRGRARTWPAGPPPGARGSAGCSRGEAPAGTPPRGNRRYGSLSCSRSRSSPPSGASPGGAPPAPAPGSGRWASRPPGSDPARRRGLRSTPS